MRRDHRPYYFKRLYMKLQSLYTKHFLWPQFDSLGRDCTFIQPWNVEIFGSRITLGDYAHVLTTSDNKVRFTVWPQHKGKGQISIGDYCLICPGVRISSADRIIIENNCMLAGNTFITDSDWHGTYDRVKTIGETGPIHIRNNVWLGDRVTVCKGVTIGENSIIGAGSVVVRDIPPNVIAAGNPARVVKNLDTNQPLVKRESWFANPNQLERDIDAMDRENLAGNRLLHWMRTMIIPNTND